MPYASTGVRVLLVAVVLVILGGTVVSLVQLTDTALSIQQRLEALPWWIAVPITLVLFALGASLFWLILRLLIPRHSKLTKVPLSVNTLRERVQKLALNAGESEQNAGISQQVDQELALLEQRAQQSFVYVAMFGEVNTGKSSLIKTLVGANVAVDVLAGSTDTINLYPLSLTDNQTIILADVPGSNEVRAPHLASLAREEALRSHLVALVVSGDLSRSAALEWQWLKQFQKPMWLILNKSDRYTADELSELQIRLRERFGADVIAVHAMYQEEVLQIDQNGIASKRLRTINGNIKALTDRLHALVATPRSSLESAREQSILLGLDAKLEQSEAQQRIELAERVIRQFTRRAMLGAMAAVAPGSDLVIQGALGLGLVHQLCGIYSVSASQIELDSLIQAIGGKLKGSIAVLIAIIGNGLKAFPGLGTLSGGALHAIAYGLIFDRVGHALQESLEQARRLATPRVSQADVLRRLDVDWRDTAELIRQAGALAKELRKSDS